ncbi:MAG: hypothetical protein ACI4O5_02735 [Oscillospiraceae bacterium]
MADKRSHRYDDLLDLPHHVSGKRSHMSGPDRAAQFSPFAALAGYDAAVRETARLTQTRRDLDESRISALNEKLQRLLELRDQRPEVTITYFMPDERKAGGAYVDVTGRVKKIDTYTHTVVMTDRTAIPIGQICGIEGGCFHDMD